MSNLLNKASIILTPTAYSDGTLHSVKPLQTLGSELVTNGDFATDSDFTKTEQGASTATITGGKANFNIVSGAYAKLTQAISYTSGRVYKLTAIVNGTNGSKMRFRDDVGNSGGLTTSNGQITMDGTDQSVEIIFIANSNSDEIAIERQDTSGNYSFRLDNLSIKEVIDADFDFTRGSSATRVNEQGLIEDVQILGGNLVTNGDFATDSDWNKGDNWTISGGTANCDGSQSTTTNFSQSNVISDQSKTYRVEFTLSNYVAGSVKSKISNDAQGVNRSANGTYVDFLSGMSNSSLNFTANADFVGSIDNVSVKEVIDADFDFTRSTTATRENSSGNIESVAANLPRIDYLGGTAHILLEPQSTNYSRNSEQPSTWHSSGNVTITANATTSPEGTTNSSLVVVNGSSGAVYARNLNNFPSGSGTQTVTLSCFLKYYNNQFIRLKSAFFTGSAANAKSSFFDIQNGVLGTVDATHTAKMEDYGGGWYRCSITFDIDKDSDTSGYIQVEPMSADNTNTFAAIGQGFYAFGSQGEELSFMTSYIPVPTSSFVTRNADVCDNSGSSDLISSTEGVLYAEINALAKYNVQRMIALNGGNHQNVVKVGINNSNTNFIIKSEIRSGNSSQALMLYDFGAVTPTMTKIAVKYKVNDFALWVNGVEVATDTSGNTPIGLNKLSFKRGDNTHFLEAKIKCVAVFKEALTDAQLTALTT